MVLTISGGRDKITIPDYQGQTLLKASTELKETYGFKVTLRYEYSEYERDIVIKTDPAAGQSLSRGETITIYVSEGSPKVTVPDIAGLTIAQAKDLLQTANLVVGPMTNMSVDPVTNLPVEVPEAQRVVIKQMPAAGEPALARSVVSIIYGTALDYQQFLNPTPTPIPVAIMPDVTGQPLLEVLDQLTELGFSIFSTVNISNNNNIPEHERIVIRQSVEPETEIELSQPITLYYGTLQDYNDEINPTTVPTTTAPTTTKKPKPTNPPTTTTTETTPATTTTEPATTTTESATTDSNDPAMIEEATTTTTVISNNRKN